MPTDFFTEVVDDSGAIHGQVCLGVGNAGLPIIGHHGAPPTDEMAVKS